MHYKILFNKENLKYFFIWLISILLSIFLRFYGFVNPESLLINNYLVLLLVFGPALVVTILLVLNKVLKVERNLDFRLSMEVIFNASG